MKGQAVPSTYQQRKEARRKEAIMSQTNQHEDKDREKPPKRRAAIYLSESGADKRNQRRNAPSIDQQRSLCRCAATALNAEVVAEYVEEPVASTLKPGMLLVLKLAGQKQRLNYLIISSWDRLACDYDDAFEIALHLSLEDIAVFAADRDDKFPWSSETPSS